MTPAELEALRRELDCSIGELADAVGVPVRSILAWEAGDEFPTKRHADRLRQLAEAGPSAFPRPRRAKKRPAPTEPLSDPRFWALFRKLLAHPELFSEAELLAERYDDPAPKT